MRKQRVALHISMLIVSYLQHKAMFWSEIKLTYFAMKVHMCVVFGFSPCYIASQMSLVWNELSSGLQSSQIACLPLTVTVAHEWHMDAQHPKYRSILLPLETTLEFCICYLGIS